MRGLRQNDDLRGLRQNDNPFLVYSNCEKALFFLRVQLIEDVLQLIELLAGLA